MYHDPERFLQKQHKSQRDTEREGERVNNDLTETTTAFKVNIPEIYVRYDFLHHNDSL